MYPKSLKARWSLKRRKHPCWHSQNLLVKRGVRRGLEAAETGACAARVSSKTSGAAPRNVRSAVPLVIDLGSMTLPLFDEHRLGPHADGVLIATKLAHHALPGEQDGAGHVTR